MSGSNPPTLTILQFPAAAPLDGTELVPVWQVSGTSRTTAAQLRSLPQYTLANLPSPATWAGSLAYLINGSSNRHLVISDGTSWRFPDGNLAG